MTRQRTEDEVCTNGVIILWSQRSEQIGPVPVRYPCCGNILIVGLNNLNRYRSGRVSRCIDCKKTTVPAIGPRPICTSCHQRPVIQYYSKGVVTRYSKLCWSCSQYESVKENMSQRVAIGLCARCGKREPLPSFRDKAMPICEQCWYRNVARKGLGKAKYWSLLYDKFISQNGLCIYSGEKLTPGINASLDHIFPISRFPEKREEPLNVQWVTDWVNSMKGNDTHDEFITRLHTILSSHDEFITRVRLIVARHSRGNS